MDKPTDYPVLTEHTEKPADDALADFTYAALKDRVEAKQVVTDEMIRIARANLEAAHCKPADSEPEPDKFKLSSIWDRFKTD